MSLRTALYTLLFLFLPFCKVLCAEEVGIIVCEHGKERMEWDLEFIRHARHSIDLSGVFFHGKIADRYLAEIEQRLLAEPELQVRMMITPICAEPENLSTLERMRRHYPGRFLCEETVAVAGFAPDVHAIENHVKICIVDGYYFSIGGTNITDYEYVEGLTTPTRSPHQQNSLARRLAAGFRDGNVVGRGAVGHEMHRQFGALFALWSHYNQTFCLEKSLTTFLPEEEEERGEKPYVELFEKAPRKILLPEERVQFLVGGPHQKQNAITAAYLRLIQEARREIWIAHMFCFPEEHLFSALLDAVRRGVHLEVVTNGLGGTAPKQNDIYGWANRMSYVPLFYGKEYKAWDYFSMKKEKPYSTSIYEYGIPDVQLHKKVMLVDGRFLMVGSYNLGDKSDRADYEMNLLIDSERVVAEARKFCERERYLSRKVSPDQAVSWYFDPVKSYAGRLQRLAGGLWL